ncbi:hypothetical protein [Pseudomonas purpurea]|uniref:hypothetical protein n=1 Tax=Pseudomonas purpurea TaxID=3136737 RepID=UPI0032676BE2
MTFKTHVLPGVRAFASSMRVKHDVASRARAPFSAPVPGVKPAHRQVHWRVSPATGQLEQRWSLADSQDPQSRSFFGQFARASLLPSVYTGAHAG